MFIIQLINILQIFSNIIYYSKPVYNTSEEIIDFKKQAYKIFSIAHIFTNKMKGYQFLEYFSEEDNMMFFKIFNSLKNIENHDFPSYINIKGLNIRGTNNEGYDFLINDQDDKIYFNKIKCKIGLKIEKSYKNIIQRFIENSKNESKLEVEILINETIENICILSVTCIKEKEAEFIVTNNPLQLNNGLLYLDKLDPTDTSNFDRKSYFFFFFSYLNNIKYNEMNEIKIKSNVNTKPIMVMQLERLKNLSPIYLDEQKLFSFNFEINYNNNVLKDYYIKFKHPTSIKEKSIEIYTLTNNFYNNENNYLKQLKINLETTKINSIEEDIFCRTFIEIISKKSDIITIKVLLMKKDLNKEILKEINEKKIKISMKLNNNNYTSIPLNDNLQIGYKDIFISFIFEIKKQTLNNNNDLQKIYEYFSVENKSFESNFSSLKITTLSKKTLAEYQIFMKNYVSYYFIIFMKPINQLYE